MIVVYPNILLNRQLFLSVQLEVDFWNIMYIFSYNLVIIHISETMEMPNVIKEKFNKLKKKERIPDKSRAEYYREFGK